jgi:hypothetical protein
MSTAVGYKFRSFNLATMLGVSLLLVNVRGIVRHAATVGFWEPVVFAWLEVVWRRASSSETTSQNICSSNGFMVANSSDETTGDWECRSEGEKEGSTAGSTRKLALPPPPPSTGAKRPQGYNPLPQHETASLLSQE